MKKKTRKICNTIQWWLFGIGFIALIVAIPIHDSEGTLVCFGVGMVCLLPMIISCLMLSREKKDRPQRSGPEKWSHALEHIIAVCGGSFYVMLIVMKVLRGFDLSIPDWL